MKRNVKVKKGKSSGKKNEKHWTDEVGNFMSFIGFDFVDQLEECFIFKGISQKELAKSMRVTEGRISQVLNNPGNLSLETMIKLTQSVGAKISVVVYDYLDENSKRGPLSGAIFSECWKSAGAPISVHSKEVNFIESGVYEYPKSESPQYVLNNVVSIRASA